MTEQLYKIPDNLLCNLQFRINYIRIPTWKNVDPNYVHIYYRVQQYLELDCLFIYFFVQCHHMSLWTSWSSLLGMAGL